MSELAEANRKHWDSKAREYDSKPWQKKMIEYISSQLYDHREFFGITEKSKDGYVRLLDYACGPGTISKVLGPLVATTIGVDVSANMVDTYNQRVREKILPSSCMAYNGNLLCKEPYLVDADGEKSFTVDPAFEGFDVCIVGLGFHHFEQYTLCIRQLSGRMKVGGVIGVVDLFPEKAHDDALTPDMKAMMHKSGFTAAEMKGYMSEAGLVDVEVVELKDAVIMQIHGKELERRLFFARGRKA